MKKTVLCLLAAMLCLLCVTAVWAAESTLPELCPHCGTAANWQPISEPASNNTLTEGHYYVTKDLSGKAWYTDGKVCLHMNGKTVNGSSRVFYINKGSELNLMGEGNAIGNAYASGSTATGGVVYVNGGTLNLHGPTIKNKGVSGRMAKYGGVVHINGGVFHLYSGAVTGGYDPTTTGATLVARVCTDLGIPYEAISKGDVLQFGNVKMECVWPMPAEGDGLIVGGEEINNTSIVTRFDYGEHSSLFTADVYTTGEKMILEQVDNRLLDVDFLKVPHHGYNTSSSFEFIEAISPEVAMATGRLPIPSSVRSRYENAGITFLDDRTNGYVEVTGSADGMLEYVVSRTEATDDIPEAGDDVTPDGSED